MSRRQETSELTKEQQEELKELQKQMIDEAKKVRNDFKDNPSEESGSYVNIHETSPYLNETWTGDSWKKVIYSDNMGQLLKDVKKHNEKIKNKKDAD